MSQASGGVINLRVGVNAEQAKASLRELGPVGRQALGDLDRSLKQPGPALRALDAGVVGARTSMAGFAGRAGVAGEALAAFGLAGIGAAVGLVGLVGALAGARQAMDFADELADTADHLHITTDALQEWRYAVRMAGGEAADFDSAMDAFGISLGKAASGASKALKPFEQLKFTQADLKGFKDAGAAFEEVVARLAEMQNGPQKDALIEMMGLGKVRALVMGGVDAIKQMRQEAHALGLVMDAGLIARAAAAKDEFDTMAGVIDVQLKSALVDLAPVLTGLMGLLAGMARLIGDIVDGLRKVENRTTDGLQRALEQAKKERADAAKGNLYVLGEDGSAFQFNDVSSLDATIARIEEELAAREASAAKVGKGTGIGEIGDLNAPKGPKGPTDADRLRAGNSALDAALASLNKAQAALTESISERARLAREAVDAELRQRNSRIDADIAEKKMNADLGRQAKAANEEAALAEKALIDRRELRDLQAAELEAVRRSHEAERMQHDIGIEVIELQAQMAETLLERWRLERESLRRRQWYERQAMALENDELVAAGRLSRAQADQREADLRQRQNLEVEGLDRSVRDQFSRGIRGALDAARGGFDSLAEHFATKLSDSIQQSLADGLAELLMQWLRSMRQAQAEGAPGGGGGGWLSSAVSLGARILGFSGGGNPPTGVPYWVGEHGPELRVDHQPGHIIPSHAALQYAGQAAGRGVGGGDTFVNVLTSQPMEQRTTRQADGTKRVDLYEKGLKPMLQHAKRTGEIAGGRTAPRRRV